MNAPSQLDRKKYRTVWISDVHLGYKGCKADYLLHFLCVTDCKYLYLVGDIFDLWSLKRSFYWPQVHNAVVREILAKAKAGTKVIYVPGNHDELLRDYHGMSYGNVIVRNKYVHHSVNGERVLILHGDEFDGVIKCGRLATFFGNKAYDFLLYVNRVFNHFRRRFGLPYWSLAKFMKTKIKNAMQHVENFERAAAYEAGKRGCSAVVCGHIHHAEIKKINGIMYMNTGDWVENCTAMVEHLDGAIELLHWSEMSHTVKSFPIQHNSNKENTSKAA